MTRGHGSPSSRSSLTGVGFLPVIAEDEVARPPSKPAVALPPRVPQKSPRRTSSPRGLPPPYVPPYVSLAAPTLHPPPPSYREESDGKVGAGGGEYGGRRSLASRLCCVLGAVLAVLAVLAIALAVGLTVGLKNKEQQTTKDADVEDQTFPAGSFSFNVNLQETTTRCTSNPTTWRCYPYTEGDAATFFWIIASSSSSNYTISATDNPFAPSFANRSLAVVDAGKPTERLRFSFTAPKTVAPSEQLTPDNRAVQCVFDATRFEATLWTRRRGNHTVVDPEPGRAKFADWPADAEVVQSKAAARGQPRCEDSNGNRVSGVKSGSGTCECRYSNFDLED
ncbi:hypothetical protein AK830_g3172 [Neonectria ditissima]|uniref:Tat pathway signal sequence n=1 Tax=Neonectria ditissima TaxID=78410 RepID=A0A0P7B9B5_9HYPO|nr:hypothetical protein AK830_g3172 [Neonectria ditissima]